MALPNSKTRTPAETAAIIFAHTVKQGLDRAQTAVVRILGRKPPFVHVRIGRTDINLGQTAQARPGYTVTALLPPIADAKAGEAIEKALADWLHACHGARFVAGGGKPVLKPGSKTLYLAVAYPPKDEDG